MKDNFEEMMKMLDRDDKIVISWKKGDPTSAMVEGIDCADTEKSAKAAAAIFHAGAMLTGKAVDLSLLDSQKLAIYVNHSVTKFLLEKFTESVLDE